MTCWRRVRDWQQAGVSLSPKKILRKLDVLICGAMEIRDPDVLLV
jgi:hypothetical protein